MSREFTITFRVSLEELNLISKLCQILQRSRSDAIRFVLLNIVKKLEVGMKTSDLFER